MFFLKATTVAMGYWWVKIVDKSGTKDDLSKKGKHKKKKPSKLLEIAQKAQNVIIKTPSIEAPILAVVPHQSIFDFLAILYLGLPVLVARYEGSHHWMMRLATIF